MTRNLRKALRGGVVRALASLIVTLSPIPGFAQTYSEHLDCDGDDDLIAASTADSNDGTIIVGSCGSDAWAVRLDDSGAVDWEMTYAVGSSSLFRSVVELASGDLVAIGDATVSGDTELYVAGIAASDGSRNWQWTYGGSEYDAGWDVAEQDDQVVAVGTTRSFDTDTDSDMWILLLDGSNGQIVDYTIPGRGTFSMQARIGGDEDDGAYSVLVADPANCDLITAPEYCDFVVAGYTLSYGADSATGNYSDMWILRNSREIASDWQVTLGFSGSNESAYGLTRSGGSGGDIAVVGDEHAQDSNGRTSIWAVLLNQYGSLRWERCIRTSNDVHEYGREIMEHSSDGNLWIAGYGAADPTANPDRDDEDILLIEIDETNGNVLTDKFVDHEPSSDYDDEVGIHCISEAFASAGAEIILTGGSLEQTLGGDWDWWAFRLDTNGDVNPSGTAGICNFDDAGLDDQATNESYDTTTVQAIFTDATEDDPSSSSSTTLSKSVDCTCSSCP